MHLAWGLLVQRCLVILPLFCNGWPTYEAWCSGNWLQKVWEWRCYEREKTLSSVSIITASESTPGIRTEVTRVGVQMFDLMHMLLRNCGEGQKILAFPLVTLRFRPDLFARKKDSSPSLCGRDCYMKSWFCEHLTCLLDSANDIISSEPHKSSHLLSSIAVVG